MIPCFMGNNYHNTTTSTTRQVNFTFKIVLILDLCSSSYAGNQTLDSSSSNLKANV